MKKKIITYGKDGPVEKEIQHIPVRFILAITLMIFETLAVLGIVIWLTNHIPLFFISVFLTQCFCALKIINSPENPDYKVPWLLVVLTLPIAGFMIYFMFYDRKLSKKFIKRSEIVREKQNHPDDSEVLMKLEEEDRKAYLQAKLLRKLSNTHIYQNTEAEYFDMGEKLFPQLLEDLKKAEKFIFMEYFIIEEGIFWNSILEILKEKAANGVEVRVIYDDIGCMFTLPGDYFYTLRKMGIKAVSFSMLKGQANNEFNTEATGRLR